MQKFLFSTVRDIIIAQARNFTKNDLFCKYFVKILIISVEQLFLRTLPDDYSENIKICNSLYYISRHLFLVLFLINTEEIKSHEIQVV